MALQANLILNLYDIGIHKEIFKERQLNNAFRFRFVKRLCDEYGVSRRNSEWAVSLWFSCYAETILNKKYKHNIEKGDAIGNDLCTKTATFDVASNDYIDDWRNIFEYEIKKTGVTILMYIAFDTEEVTVPSYIEGYPVVEIGKEAFENCKAMTRINLPETILIIGDSAFRNCTFRKIDLPQSLTKIGAYAFGNTMISELIFPPEVKNINAEAFYNCRQLKKIVFPKGLLNIGDGAFMGCRNFICADIPDGVEMIGVDAFKDCYGLIKLRVPDSVTKIGWHNEYMNEESVFTDSRIHDELRQGKYIKDNITIYCNAGSEILKYARKHGIKIARYEEYKEGY